MQSVASGLGLTVHTRGAGTPGEEARGAGQQLLDTDSVLRWPGSADAPGLRLGTEPFTLRL